ncbi:hypothetical protein POM88_035308 [Heracleum sosnowskyi]|uniref:Uncharacterized protein n=1 Tax=Heracleum sosnowskyi TaxID=360622 RepID=A0AAD8HL89_9APIA|nr:hypothetical protein POM88_035308 [Heracleum sosnowskyi]
MDKSGIATFVDEYIVSKRRAGCDENSGLRYVNSNANENSTILNLSQQNSFMSIVTNGNQNPNVLTSTISVTDSARASGCSCKLFHSGPKIQDHDNQNASSAKLDNTPSHPILNNDNIAGLSRSLNTSSVERVSTSIKHKSSRTVSSSGTTFQSPVSRLINSTPVVKDKQSTFQLHASRITPRSAQVDTNKQQRLFDTYNRDRGLQVLPKYNLKHNLTQIDSRIIETSESAKKKENHKFITVTVPHPEHLGVKRPVWFPPSSSHKTNFTEIHKSTNVESSSSGVKNLMSEFNDADEDQIGKDPIDDYIMNPDNQVYENIVSDEEADEDYAY